MNEDKWDKFIERILQGTIILGGIAISTFLIGMIVFTLKVLFTL